MTQVMQWFSTHQNTDTHTDQTHFSFSDEEEKALHVEELWLRRVLFFFLYILSQIILYICLNDLADTAE